VDLTTGDTDMPGTVITLWYANLDFSPTLTAEFHSSLPVLISTHCHRLIEALATDKNRRIFGPIQS
jgi:hypothetical protein